MRNDLGLYQYGYGMRVDDDHTLTIEDITQGFDVSDVAIFADVIAAHPNVSHGKILPRSDGNSDADILRSVFDDDAPRARPFAGRRSQHDRD
jgi:hypothetical protein